MSVLVKGIDMPQSCGGCEFLCYPFHEPVCFLTREIIVQPRYKSLRQTLLMKKDNCPLVEVSDGQEEWLDGMNVLYGEEEDAESEV